MFSWRWVIQFNCNPDDQITTKPNPGVQVETAIISYTAGGLKF
jgi:hypothetical protein